MTVSGAVRAARRRGAREAQGAVDAATPSSRARSSTRRPKRRPCSPGCKKSHEHDVIETIRLLREKADAFAARHNLPKPAVVGTAGAAGRRLRGHRDRRPTAGGGRHGPDRPGHADRDAEASGGRSCRSWPAGRSGWRPRRLLHVFDIRLSLSGGPLVAQIIVLTMPAASHLAIHFRDDLRRDGDPRSRRPARRSGRSGLRSSGRR